MHLLPRVVLAALLLAAVLAPAAAAAQTPLTAAQFTALDGVYTVQIKYDDDESAKAYAASRAACRMLDSGDGLLSALRKACSTSLASGRAANAFSKCRTPLGCLRTARRARIAFTAAIAVLRAMNRAIDAAMLVPACRGELRASKSDLRYLERTRDFLRLFQDAATTGSPRLASRLEREAKALGRVSRDDPSAARERKTFRAACTPPAG